MNVVDAVQVPYRAAPGELMSIVRWCHGMMQVTGDAAGDIVCPDAAGDILRAGPGWWIIRSVEGKFTVMAPGTFELGDEVTG